MCNSALLYYAALTHCVHYNPFIDIEQSFSPILIYNIMCACMQMLWLLLWNYFPS